jgi:NADH:ubiquinone oxidoreductase subunit 3 (subunit A)
MRTYQTLSLIGCILGILLSIGLGVVIGFLTTTSDVFFNMSRPTETERQEHESSSQPLRLAAGGFFLAFFLYVAILVITFVVKTKTKIVGVIILVLGVLAMAITNLWGIIPFALLLPAGILAIRHKHQPVTTTST